jgi:hypothetical protein
MNYKIWSKIGAIWFAFWGLSAGLGWTFLSIKDTRLFTPSGYSIILLIVQFLIQSVPYILPSIPLWYYGWRTDE